MPVAKLRDESQIADESDILAQTRAGSSTALASLYEEHAGRLLAIAYRLLGTREDAEDVVHDVFVGLPDALRRYEERGAFAPWLRKVTARVALARLRETNRRATVALDDSQAAAPPAGNDASSALELALRDLSPSLRAVVVLKEIEGFSHREIAAMLGISVAASEVRLHRAIRALREKLEKEKS